MAHFGVGAAGLAAQWARPLLPAEPRIPDRLQQERLTAEHLMPCLAEVEAFFLGLRARLDPVLQARKPHKLGKPYPLGQCLEISLAAQEQLPQVREAAVGQASLPGDVLKAVSHALGSVAQAEGLQFATDAVDGRRRALQACRQARQRRQHRVRGQSDRVSDVIHRLNLRLLVPI